LVLGCAYSRWGVGGVGGHDGTTSGVFVLLGGCVCVCGCAGGEGREEEEEEEGEG
jgi:hypothetical protein